MASVEIPTGYEIDPLSHVSRGDIIYQKALRMLQRKGWQIALRRDSNPVYASISLSDSAKNVVKGLLESNDFAVVRAAFRGFLRPNEKFDSFDEALSKSSLDAGQREFLQTLFHQVKALKWPIMKADFQALNNFVSRMQRSRRLNKIVSAIVEKAERYSSLSP